MEGKAWKKTQIFSTNYISLNIILKMSTAVTGQWRAFKGYKKNRIN